MLYVTHTTDPYFNLALEETLLRTVTENSMLLWRNDNAVIVGNNQQTEREVNAAFVRTHGIRVVRRITGGGAVYHDLGNVNYSILHVDGDVDIHAFAVGFLAHHGITATLTGNDILVDGRKISGTARATVDGRTLHHGTLLFDTNLDMLEGVLTPDVSKLHSKGISSVKQRVRLLNEYIDADREGFFDQTIAYASGMTPLGDISDDVIQAAQTLADAKYRRRTWTYS